MKGLIREARDWLADCTWGDDPDFDSMTDEQIRRGVGRNYDGGWPAFARDARSEEDDMTPVLHYVGFWQDLLERLFNRDPRALCGASLVSDTDADDPGLDAPDCPRCVTRASRTATRSWNLAIVTLGVCLAMFAASVVASAYAWHPALTSRTAGVSALAVIACGVWLLLSAARFGPLEPEPDEDEEAGAP